MNRSLAKKKFAFILFALISLAVTGMSGLSGSGELDDRCVLPQTEGHEISLQERQSSFRKVENAAFAVGEKLIFDITFGFIRAGRAVLDIPEYRTLGDRRCYWVRLMVTSAAAFSWLYKVEDRYETYLDCEGLFPWQFEQHMREGGYRRDFAAYFDQVAHRVTTTEGQYDIPPYVHDIVSAFYYVRTLDFRNSRPGQRLHFQNFYKDSTFALDVKFLGRQTVEVNAGTFDCILVEPLVKEGGLFKSEGRIIIWLTDDEKKIPVKVSAQIAIGSIDVELREYHGVNDPFRAKKD
jgi:hypothetical protein